MSALRLRRCRLGWCASSERSVYILHSRLHSRYGRTNGCCCCGLIAGRYGLSCSRRVCTKHQLKLVRSHFHCCRGRRVGRIAISRCLRCMGINHRLQV